MFAYSYKPVKQVCSIAGLFMLMLAAASCEKVIDVKLDDADKKFVVDAVLTDQAGDCVVKLSQTKNFSEDNTFNGFSGAAVTIKDPEGNITTLAETTPGVYTNTTLKGASGKAYELTVTVAGNTFRSTSVMPDLVPLDSIYVKTQKFFDEDETFSSVVFNDPGGVRNYYRFVQLVNGERTKGNFIMDDDLSDGKLFNSTLYFFTDKDEDKIKPGDKVTIEMQCIEAPVYKYWFSLDQSSSGSSQSAAPANPVSNVSGGALGYFSAHTVVRKSLIAP